MKRALLLSLALVPLTALAQFTPQYLPYKMLNGANNKFPYYVDSRSTMPLGLSQALAATAGTNAWDTWNAVSCALPKTQFKGQTGSTVPNPADPYDAFSVTPVFLLSFSDPDWNLVFGTTSIASITLPLAYAGVLEQCDTYINGPAAKFSTLDMFPDGGGGTPSDAYDLQTMLLHEAGHCLGMDHWGLNNVMSPGIQQGSQRRTPTQDDVMALCNRNPIMGGIGSPCLADGGCGSTVSGIKCVTQPLATGTASFCTIGCQAGSGFVCEVPLTCQPATFFSPQLSGACLRSVNTVTIVGSPCTMDTMCGSSTGKCQLPGALPSGFPQWDQGYCYQTCATGQPTCPAGSACTDVGGTVPDCLKSCRVGLADCRPNYACADTVNGGVCVPACHTDSDCGDVSQFECRVCDGLCVSKQNAAGQVGDVCTQELQCGAGQLCSAIEANNPGKLCTLSCGKGCGTCPAGSACHPVAPSNALYCLRSCTGPGTCPAGSRCANLPTGRACMPPCQNDFDCPVGEACTGGECYNPGEDDAGCGAFCETMDSGNPIIVPKKDGGSGAGGSGGCGCQSSADLSALALIGLCGMLRSNRRTRERAWQRR